MVRKSSLIGGVGLAILWALGRALDPSAGIVWFDAVAAIVSFGVAALVDDAQENPARAFGPMLIGLGLMVLFVVGATTRGPAWATWLNLVFAVAYLTLGLAVLAGSLPRLSRVRAHRR